MSLFEEVSLFDDPTSFRGFIKALIYGAVENLRRNKLPALLSAIALLIFTAFSVDQRVQRAPSVPPVDPSRNQQRGSAILWDHAGSGRDHGRPLAPAVLYRGPSQGQDCSAGGPVSPCSNVCGPPGPGRTDSLLRISDRGTRDHSY